MPVYVTIHNLNAQPFFNNKYFKKDLFSTLLPEDFVLVFIVNYKYGYMIH